MTDAAALEPAEIVLVYGRDTCEDTTRAREHLERAGVPFRYLRVDEDEDARTWSMAPATSRRRSS